MKYLILIFLLASCSTSPQQDTQMLQTKYETVYRVDIWNYITCDSAHVYHVKVTRDGVIETTIKVK